MRKLYPYLESPYGETIQQLTEKKSFLSTTDDFLNRKQYVKITLLNWLEEPLKEIEGELTTGSISKDGSSSVRRTCTLSASVNGSEYSVEDGEMDFAINKKIFIEIGIKNYTDEYPEYPILWFPQGVFFIGSFSISSSATAAVNINLSLKDKMAGLNGDVGGKFPATVVLDEVDTQSPSGEYISEKVLLYNLIQELVNHFGGENLNNIVIEDVPLRIKRVLRWTGDNPIYMTPPYDANYTDGSTEGWYTFDVNQPTDVAYQTFNYGDDVGYIYDDFVYTGELIAAPGESVVTILEKIKNYLGNYEFFYDVFGIFHFREIKNYLNTTQAKTLLDDMNKNEYLVDVTTGKTEYTFSDDNNLISINANPQYENIKNDYIVQGLRKMTGTDISYPIRYHLAIDTKPATGNVYKNLLLYTEDTTNEKKAYFPLTVNTEADLPLPGNFNVIYHLKNTNEFVYWANEVYKPVTKIKYYPDDDLSDGYITKDWRTEIYLQGLLVKNNGLSASQYYSDLQKGLATVNLSETATWVDKLYLRNSSNKIDIDFYFEELEAFWPQIYDLEKQQFYGQEVSQDLQHTALTDGNYFLDFIDPTSSAIGEFSVQNIGRRTDVVVNEEINCLFEPEYPNIVFLNTDDEDIEEKRNECIENGQPFTQVRGDIFHAFATGGYHNGAFDQIKYELYLHTNYQKTLSVTAIPVLYLEPNTRVSMNDKSTNTYGDYMIKNLSIPLGAGSTMAVSMNECFERF